MGTRYNAAAILAGMGAVVSQEDNDLNINIQADHEGDGEQGADGVSDFDNTPAETEPAVDVTVDENIGDDTSGTPETAELDVAEAGGEVEQVTEQIEDVNDVAAGLESIVVQLATISQEGIEVTPFLADSIRTQYNFVTRKFPKLRVDATGNDIVASTESWTVSQESETESLMGKAVGKLKGAGQAVIKFLKDLWERIKALFGNLTAAGAVMRKKAEAVQKRKATGKGITLPGVLTSAPFSADSINKIAGLIDGITSTRLNVSKLLTEGWPAQHIAKGVTSNTSGGVFLGNFAVKVVDGMPTIVSAEATKEKDVKISQGDVTSIGQAVAKLGASLEKYKSMEKARKEINDALIRALEAEVTPEDAGRYAKWKLAREVSTKWGKYTSFETRLVKKAVSVGNAANNALSAATAKE